MTRGASAVGRSLGLTWWYTVASVLVLQVGLLTTWAPTLTASGLGWSKWAVYAASAAVWVASSALMLADYRNRPRTAAGSDVRSRRGLLPWAGTSMTAAALGLATGSLLLAAAVAVHPVCLLRFSAGTRRRISALQTLLLASLAVLEASVGSVEFGGRGVAEVAIGYAVLTAPLTSFTLWWWDLVEELDRARLTEGRLAATQERLRVASDVHDLQGHHLQVIALQLELAERLLGADPDAAVVQVRAARTSVDEARQGTRDLALRFRGVSLPDELANAADLMHAADLRVGLEVTPDAAEAPADVLGPVVRETTTNVLKHGAGTWVEMSLVLDADRWTYRISNDHDRPDAAAQPGASGIAGIVDRVRAVGGDASVERTASTFAVLVSVPGRPEEESR